MLNPKTAIATAGAGFALLVPAYVGLFLSGTPTILSPLPALTVIPAFTLSTWHLEKTAIVVPMVFFFVWQLGLFRGETVVPKRTYFLYAIATLLSIVYIVVSWKWGIQYQGIQYTHAVCAVNLAWIGFLGLAFGRAWRGMSSFGFNLLLHWMLFAWLGWYAFPYLGELP